MLRKGSALINLNTTKIILVDLITASCISPNVDSEVTYFQTIYLSFCKTWYFSVICIFAALISCASRQVIELSITSLLRTWAGDKSWRRIKMVACYFPSLPLTGWIQVLMTFSEHLQQAIQSVWSKGSHTWVFLNSILIYFEAQHDSSFLIKYRNMTGYWLKTFP